ncbi:MAG TPA: ABC transporter permease [Acidimicrobiales bacterium]|nr:ABC transporter permease [Acidimicrobiales bacterium]
MSATSEIASRESGPLGVATGASRSSRAEMVVEGGASTPLLRSLALLWAHREVVWSFARRSFGVRYKQSVLGVAWAVVQPLATLGIFVVFFGKVARVSGGGVPYAAFALSALGPWQFVNSAVTFSSLSLVNEGSLLRKVYFPREAAVLGAIASNLVDLGIMLGLLLVLEPVLGGHEAASLLWTPLLVVALLVPVVGVALPLAGLAVFFRDVKYVVPFAVQFTMFASPVVYPVSRVPLRWQHLYAALDPLVGPIDGFRRVFALGTSPDFALLAISGLTGGALLLGGYLLFKRLEPEMADVV